MLEERPQSEGPATTSAATDPSPTGSGPGTGRPLGPWQRRVLEAVLRGMGRPPVAVELWNGEVLAPPGPERARVRILAPSVLREFAHSPEVAFGDAYCDGRIDVDDLDGVLAAVFAAGRASPHWFRVLTHALGWRPRGQSGRWARRNVHHHYDLGNEFYQMWLDERLVYTCAYFATPESTLEEAQLAKMDHVCRKLLLRPGERVVEAGCGWGSLALHMAEHYGARVRAFNISEEQVRYARERARQRGVEKQVEFVQDDWRAVRGTWDAFVSVGMLEHVGKAHYRELGGLIDRSLGAGGRGLLHFIGHARPQPTSPWLERRIFPGAYMPSLSEAMRVFEPFDLAVHDVENLRRHYALTLEHWRARFERASDLIEGMYDGRFVRMWRLYLASSKTAFDSGSTQLWQILFARRADTALPWTRSYMYE